MGDYNAGKALGFLPVEMLAIVDIYDAMIDSSRSYKKAMTPVEAINFMLAKPVTSGKLDPILFDIFIDFLKARKTNLPPELGISARISRRSR